MGLIKLLKSVYYELTIGEERIDKRDSYGATLLHKAIREGNLDKTEWLIKKGADIEAQEGWR